MENNCLNDYFMDAIKAIRNETIKGATAEEILGNNEIWDILYEIYYRGYMNEGN